MARPAKVYHVNLVIPQGRVEKLLVRLHEEGLCQIKECKKEQGFEIKFPHDEGKQAGELLIRLRRLIDVLDEYKDIPQPENMIKSLINPKAPKRFKVEVKNNQRIYKDVEKRLTDIEPRVLDVQKELEKTENEIEENKFLIENLSKLPNQRTDLFESSKNLFVYSGLVTKTSFPKIEKELKEISVYGVEERGKKLMFLSLYVDAENKTKAEKLLHEAGFEDLKFPFTSKKPSSLIENAKKDLHRLDAKKKRLKKELKQTWRSLKEKLDILEEELTVALERLDALKLLSMSNSLCFFESWVPHKNLVEFMVAIKKNAPSYYLEIEEREDAPTIFKNSFLVKPFEILTELYSVPKYKNFDPTILLAFSFPLFFGFMLTDVAYGIILTGFALILYYGIGKYNEGTKKFGQLLIMLGILTIIMGAVFGSYFGTFFQDHGIPLPVPIDSMKQVMVVMGMAIGLGAIHLMTGLTIGFFENLRKKKIKAALMSQGVWLLFLPGIIMAIALKGTGSTVGLGMIGVSVFMQLLLNFIENGPVLSLLSIFNFSGFIGDLFSYARIMALAVGTSGIALAVNFMVDLSAEMIPYVGIVFAVIIFIIGHVFNMMMNGLGAFIHTMRLHFLELFSKFYDGGGKKYNPFTSKRKITYTEVEKW